MGEQNRSQILQVIIFINNVPQSVHFKIKTVFNNIESVNVGGGGGGGERGRLRTDILAFLLLFLLKRRLFCMAFSRCRSALGYVLLKFCFFVVSF